MCLDQTFHPNSVSEKVALKITEETLIKFGFCYNNKWKFNPHVKKTNSWIFLSKLRNTGIITFFRNKHSG
jgi:hypothetical protein